MLATRACIWSTPAVPKVVSPSWDPPRAETSIVGLTIYPVKTTERQTGLSGLEAYTAKARAHGLSSCVPDGCENCNCPLFINSYRSLFILHYWGSKRTDNGLRFDAQ